MFSTRSDDRKEGLEPGGAAPAAPTKQEQQVPSCFLRTSLKLFNGKNHYGSRSVLGTEVAAVFHTLIESAKLAGVGPHTYLHAAINAALRGVEIPLPHEMR
ncbi:MAG TPA: hypothetical protein VN764_10170 [Polyangiaceae bacterium]|nr:hypothetical protein [Polyangiaceae bacterium]